ncbi:MAG TPA: hypothetical protein VMT76_13565 [Puia sp.]|nr:hypothetical protein [Puia sp.]
MPHVLLFIFYFFVFLLVLTAIIRAKKIDIPFRLTFFIFAYKVLMGCAYGYILWKYYKGDDSWEFNRGSLIEHNRFIQQPVDFFRDLLYKPPLELKWYLNYLEYYSITKPLGIFNIFSHGNYYINVIFFDFISIIGLLLLYKLLTRYFNEQKKIIIAVLFFLPLTSFWLSGIRAEALLLLCISVILYFTDKFINTKKKLIYPVYIIAAFAECMILRGQMLLVLLPAFFCLAISWKKPKWAVRYFCITYITGIIFFLGSMFISKENNFATPIIKRQQEFLSLHANTVYKIDSLQPSAARFAKVLPQAFANSFLRPFVWEATGALQLFTSFDILLFWIILFVVIRFHKKNWEETANNPLFLFFIFYGFTQIILIGYVIPFPGAMVRYKSIPELFLFLSLALMVNRKRICSKKEMQNRKNK